MESNSDTPAKTKAINKSTFYLGLQVTDPLENLIQIILTGLKGIAESYPKIEDAKKLIDNFEENTFTDGENYKAPWRFPKDDQQFHITTLFKKGRSFNLNHPAYTNFEQGKTLTVEIRGIVYIPSKIITSLVYTESPVENEFPHMTILLGSYSAKHSNDVCRQLFSKERPLEKDYKNLMKNELVNESCVYRVEIDLFDKKEIAYAYTFSAPVQVECEMKAFSR